MKDLFKKKLSMVQRKESKNTVFLPLGEKKSWPVTQDLDVHLEPKPQQRAAEHVRCRLHGEASPN